MDLTTTAQITQAVNAYYNRKLLENARPFLPHAMFADVKPLPANNGTLVKFRRYGTLAPNTTPLTEGITPEGKQLSHTDIQTTVEQYGDFVIITDKLLFTTLDPVLSAAAAELGEQAGQSLDIVIANVVHAGTNVQYSNGVAGRGSITTSDKLDAAEIKLAVRTLKRLLAQRITSMVKPDAGYGTTPVDAAYIGIVHPDTTNDLWDDSKFRPVEEYANKANVMPHEVGKMLTVRFIESTFAKVFEGEGVGGIDVYSTVILGKHAYGITQISGHALENIVKPLGSAGTSDPLNQRASSGWKATMAAIRLNEDYMVRIEHATTA